MRRMLATAISGILAMTTPVAAETLNLYAAGSLKAALTAAARAFEVASGSKHTIITEFAASGLLRERIEKGEAAHVFASADMAHPKTLADAGRATGKVRMFARNQLCAITRNGIGVTPEKLLDRMLDPSVRLGISTPKADPSGDYALTLFAKADALKPGARASLEAKALKLTGGPDTAKAPQGRNQYGWVMSENKADIFLTYCTNAVLAKKDTPSLEIVTIPAPIAVGAEYGMIVLKGAPEGAQAFSDFILGPEAQQILRDHGFWSGDASR